MITYAYKNIHIYTYLLTFIHARISTHLNDTYTCICKRTIAYRYENVITYGRTYTHPYAQKITNIKSIDGLTYIHITVNTTIVNYQSLPITSKNEIRTHDRKIVCCLNNK